MLVCTIAAIIVTIIATPSIYYGPHTSKEDMFRMERNVVLLFDVFLPLTMIGIGGTLLYILRTKRPNKGA